MILFDNEEQLIYESKISLPGSKFAYTPRELIKSSERLSQSEKMILDKETSFKNLNIRWSEIGVFKSEKELNVFTYKEGNSIYIFEFGEFQPSRFILNLLSVLDASILENREK